MQFQNSFKNLAQKVEAGDANAKAQFARNFEPQLARIVRRVLEKGTATSSLERRILATAQRLRPVDASGGIGAAALAENLCDMVVSRLWPGATETRHQATLLA